jgi:hypothetical protein
MLKKSYRQEFFCRGWFVPTVSSPSETEATKKHYNISVVDEKTTHHVKKLKSLNLGFQFTGHGSFFKIFQLLYNWSTDHF